MTLASMNFVRLYARVIYLLAPERGRVLALMAANVALAGTAFVGPLLFGRLIDTLAATSSRPGDETFRQTCLLLGGGASSEWRASAPASWQRSTQTACANGDGSRR